MDKHSPDSSQTRWYEYDFAIIRLVPRIHRGECLNVGVLVHAPSAGKLAARFVDRLDTSDPRLKHEQLDPALVLRYLKTFEAIVGGEGAGGPIASLSRSERFHWLTAPRSDILQPTDVHHGRCHDLESCVEELFEEFVVS